MMNISWKSLWESLIKEGTNDVVLIIILVLGVLAFIANIIFNWIFGERDTILGLALHYFLVALVLLIVLSSGILQFLLFNTPSSWWLLVAIPALLIMKYVPWTIGPAGIPPSLYARSIINPIKYAIAAKSDAGRLSFFGYWLISFLYKAVGFFLILFNIILIVRLLMPK